MSDQGNAAMESYPEESEEVREARAIVARHPEWREEIKASTLRDAERASLMPESWKALVVGRRYEVRYKLPKGERSGPGWSLDPGATLMKVGYHLAHEIATKGLETAKGVYRENPGRCWHRPQAVDSHRTYRRDHGALRRTGSSWAKRFLRCEWRRALALAGTRSPSIERPAPRPGRAAPDPPAAGAEFPQAAGPRPWTPQPIPRIDGHVFAATRRALGAAFAFGSASTAPGGALTTGWEGGSTSPACTKCSSPLTSVTNDVIARGTVT